MFLIFDVFQPFYLLTTDMPLTISCFGISVKWSQFCDTGNTRLVPRSDSNPLHIHVEMVWNICIQCNL